MSQPAETVTCPYCPPNKNANFKEIDSAGYRLFDCGEHVFRYDYRPAANTASVARDAYLDEFYPAATRDDKRHRFHATKAFEAGWDARDASVVTLGREVKRLSDLIFDMDKEKVFGTIQEENKRLREALAPFAKEFDDMKARNPGADPEVFEDPVLGKLRRASDALKAKEE